MRTLVYELETLEEIKGEKILLRCIDGDKVIWINED